MRSISATRRLTAVVAAVVSVTGLSIGVAAAGAPAGATPIGVGLDVTSYVNPFIGTQDNLPYDSTESAYGDDSPGATTPFGLVNFNPNTTGSARDEGGYHYEDSTLRGFSLDRVTGTGCAGRNGAEDFPIYPYNGALTAGALPSSPATGAGGTTGLPAYDEAFSHSNESATPGYYTVTADDGIKTELSATTRTGAGQFTFPSGKASNTLIFDASGSENGSEGSSVHIVGNDVIEGSTQVQSTCKEGDSDLYTAYFYAKFAQPFDTAGTWLGSTVTPVSGLGTGTDVSVADTPSSTNTPASDVGAYVSFAQAGAVDVSVGLSYVSAAGAQANQQAEGGQSFATVKSAAHDTWASALGSIQVTQAAGDSANRLITFYSALYHSMLEPTVGDDVDGNYMGLDRKVHQLAAGQTHEYQSFSGWDVSRDQMQLVAMLFPDRASDINQSIDEMADQVGLAGLPILDTTNGVAQGDPLDVIAASMQDFGATNFNQADLLQQVVAAQTLVPNATPNSSGGVLSTNRRGGAYQYTALGFLTGPNNGSSTGDPASETLEYATDDFAIAQLAQRQGDTADYNTFMQRAQSWQNVFDPGVMGINSRGKTGFVRGSSNSRASISSADNQYFYEGSDLQYAWNAPQNVAQLISMTGGTAAALAQLNELFSNFDPTSAHHVLPGGSSGQTVTPGHSSPYAYMTNELDSQVPEVYNWLGRPDQAADVNQEIRNTLWTDNGPDGLLGNDDLGATSAWYVWSSLGLFPAIYGTADLVVSGPTFASVKITSTGSAGRTYTINAPAVSSAAKYVTGMSVNGTASTKSWLPDTFAQQGGTLAFTMAAKPGTWGTATADEPPSFNDGSNAYNSIGAATAGNGGQASFDASNNSFDSADLPAPGSTVKLAGTSVTYTWPSSAPATPDNWLPHGQVIDMKNQRLSSISFLGSSTNGPATGFASVNYTDGTTQVVPVSLGDWTAAGVSSNVAVVTVPGRLNQNGTKDANKAMIWGTAPQTLDSWKQIASVTLPTNSNAGIMHIFAVGGAPATSAALTATAAAPASSGTAFAADVADFAGGTGATAADYTATVDWGDGSTGTATPIALDSLGNYSAFGTHTYAGPGNYSVHVQISDGTTTQTATSTVTVS